MDVVKNILEKTKSENYKYVVESLLESYHQLGFNKSTSTNFLLTFVHLNNFPFNLCDVSDEPGERFHQDINVIEERYKGQ